MQTTLRHQFMLPENTDDIPTPGAIVRDTVRDISTRADHATWYDTDETVTGRWTFDAPVKFNFGLGQDFQNRTGGARAAGDVVMIDPANDASFIQPNAVGASGGKIGVVVEAIANNAVGRVSFTGFARVKVAGGTTRGQYLRTQNASYIASGTTYVGLGTFAVAVTNPDGASTVLAFLHPGASLEAGGVIAGPLTISPSVVAASGSAIATAVTPTLTAGANNDNLYGLLVQPTYADAGFTGVQHRAIWSPTTAMSMFGGNVGVGSVPTSNQGLLIGPSTYNVVASGGNAYGLVSNPTLTANQNTGNLYGLMVNPVFADAGFTGINHYGVYSNNGLNYFAGNVGIGTFPTSDTSLRIQGAVNTVGGIYVGIYAAPTITAIANTSQMYAIQTSATFASGGFTGHVVAGLMVNSIASSVGMSTTAGILVNPVTGGGTNNYGIYINIPSGATGENYGLSNQGFSNLVGGLAVKNLRVSGTATLTRDQTWVVCTGSGYVVTLPLAPPNGTMIFITTVGAITVGRAGASDLISVGGGGVTTRAMAANTSEIFFYDSVSTLWRILSSDTI
jgi:hypothetical protein